MNYLSRINKIGLSGSGYWLDRAVAQLEFAVKLSDMKDISFDKEISAAVSILENSITVNGTVTMQACKLMEDSFAGVSHHAKNLTVLNVAHAHIDMNWMWDYSETVAITLETFRTMLNLMDEYPDFTFSQSQASVYSIVEKHEPEMLEKIKLRIKEGRWEAAASTWVEADKNMPNGESHARHILYTRRYLTQLLDLPPDALLLDFEPDTFGHNRNVPEILSKGGIKYYYHCRGYLKDNIYRWKSPSGKSILVYQDPMWYNMEINLKAALNVPEFCKKYNMDTVLKVYGVGDHGGGPTRKDIELLLDMDSWPMFPNFKFGTYREFYNKIEEIKETLPVVEGELNFVFTGCYTTQSRIKTANRIGELKLNQAETLSSISVAFAGGDPLGANYEKSWRKVLFNQFHDILPGSGTVDTREYAMGEFQKVLAFTNTGITKAMREISSQINTESIADSNENNKFSRAEGGGVGFEMNRFNVPHTERGTGLCRIINIFNPTQYHRKEIVEVIVWDWDGDKGRLSVKNSEGKNVSVQIIDFHVDYWAHKYTRLLIEAEVKPFGYATYVIYEAEKINTDVEEPDWPRIEKPDVFVLENEKIRTEFDSCSLQLKSLYDKTCGFELINEKSPAGFRYIDEDTEKGMTAWVVGRYTAARPLVQKSRIVDSCLDKNSIRQWIRYEQEFNSSKIIVKVSLDRHSNAVDYEVECDWQERPVIGKSIPQLNFAIPLSVKSKKYRYDIPFGTIERDSLEHDVPANSWITAVPESGSNSAVMMTKTKYGFRGADSTMSLTLIRSSYDPDPYPEIGKTMFSFAIAAIKVDSNYEIIKKAYEYNNKLIYISGKIQKAKMPLCNSFINLLTDNAVISAVKISEDGENTLVVRLYESEGADAKVTLRTYKKPVRASFVDLHEQPKEGTIKISGNELEFNLKAFNVETILIEF